MPGRGDPPDVLIDTSVAIALMVADHDHNRATIAAIGTRRVGLAGHAAFETYSVLTRLPPPLRRTPRAVHALLSQFSSCFLSAGGAQRLLGGLASVHIAGGATYDALVGAAAVEHRLPLATRDQRAIETYRALDVNLEVLT